MKLSWLFFVCRSCSKISGRQNRIQYCDVLNNRIFVQLDVVYPLTVLRTSTLGMRRRLNYAVLFALGLSLSLPVFAEQPNRKANSKGDDKEESRIEEEANLPIYHVPLRGIHAGSLAKSQSETKLLSPRRPQIRSPRLAMAPAFRFKNAEKQTELGKSTQPGVSNERSLSELDSLARTQDRSRQRVLYGFKQDEIHPTSPQPVLTPEPKNPIVKPVVVIVPPTAINKTPILPNNATIWVRNDSVPHRGPGPISLGGPASGKHTGIDGTEMKHRP
jgi:hypothetical protein